MKASLPHRLLEKGRQGVQRFFVILVFFVIVVFLSSQQITVAFAADKPLFRIIRDITNAEVMRDDQGETRVEDAVKNFVVGVILEDQGPVQPDEVEKAFDTGKRDTLCREQGNRKQIPAGALCDGFALTIRSMAEREEGVRALGRDLQMIAAGYEMPVDGYPGRTVNMPMRYRSIIRLWQAGPTGALSGTDTDFSVRVATMPESDELEQRFNELHAELDEIATRDKDAFTAAIWRYQYGAAFVAGERPEFPPPANAGPGDGPGTERQYLFKRWPALEATLKRIYSLNETTLSTLEPPLDRGEAIFFLPPKTYLDKLPENVILWAYSDKTVRGGAGPVSGDAGLQWRYPVEPVLPSLIGDANTREPVAGGAYPPPPVDAVGLCTFPFAQFGYLCRPQESATNQDCSSAPPEENTILLTRCQSGKATETQSGPDVCGDIDYAVPAKVPPGENPDYVCTPGRQTHFENSIGSVMCFIGQCTEQSLETHRLIPGRSPFIAGDQAFPSDSCTAPDPLLATFATPPPLTASWFPPYRPALMVKRLDTALCQTNGLPPQSPTFLCAFSALRRLSLPLHTITANPQSIFDQTEEYRTPALGLQQAGWGLGARIGTTLYAGYLQDAARSFGETMSVATEIFGKLATIRFTPEMCSRNAAGENGLMNHGDFCVPH